MKEGSSDNGCIIEGFSLSKNPYLLNSYSNFFFKSNHSLDSNFNRNDQSGIFRSSGRLPRGFATSFEEDKSLLGLGKGSLKWENSDKFEPAPSI